MKKINNKSVLISRLASKACNHPFVTLALICFSAGAIFIALGGNYALAAKRGVIAVAVFAVAFLASVVLTLKWTTKNEFNTKRAAVLIIMLGFSLRLAYVIYTTILERQHDVLSFEAVGGHLGYIKIFWDNLFSLPEGDVRNYYQYYHPPLHHFIAGALLSLFKLFGFNNINMVGEFIQFITMFYSCAIMVIVYKILRYFKLNGTAVIVGLSITAFHPTLIILSGSVNNDILSIALMCGAVLNTLYYYRKPTYFYIVKVALCVGLGMMAKLSGWMVAPAIAAVFIVVLVRQKKQWQKIIKQWLLFGVICAPLALWWSVRNAVLYGVPFNYVLNAAANSPMYVGDIPYIQRLTDFNPNFFASPYLQYNWYGDSYFEYNPTIGLLKTSMFDEAVYSSSLDLLANLLFWSNTMLIVTTLASMLYMLIKRTKLLDWVEKLFLFLLYIVPVAAYYWFCYGYPYTCTMNVRYLIVAVIVSAVFLSLFTEHISGGKRLVSVVDNKNSYKIAVNPAAVVAAITALFCVSAILTYLAIGFYPSV